jgi:hypothetical protein
MRATPGFDRLPALAEHATALAASLGAPAGASTSVGQERAILRMFGVTGIDRAGHPLAAEVVDRYITPERGRLAGGIALPFAMAAAEYDLEAHDLAIEVAARNIDLAVEAELLARPDRRAIAEAQATRFARVGLDRIDANRFARRELLALLGDPPRPWIGAALQEPAIIDAIDEAGLLIEAGVQVLLVEVPPGRELADRLAQRSIPIEPWRPGAASRSGLEVPDAAGRPVPTGSHRALGVLRRAVDESGARRRAYVRLATDAPALAAPDQAVVSAYERIDIVVADPMREIVIGQVDPRRALADHAFANRLHTRAGTSVVIPAGPLVVAADMEAGRPADPATLSGRALALQLLAVALARRNGLPESAISIGAIPDWLVDERDAPARAAAEIALRTALLPDLGLAFLEPVLEGERALTWGAIVAALLPDAGRVDLLLARAGGNLPARVRVLDAAARVAAGLAGTRTHPGLAGPALEHATGAVRAAEATLLALDATGWTALVGHPAGPDDTGIGGEVVMARAESFDPFGG